MNGIDNKLEKEKMPPGVTLGEDGKLRWSYTLNLWRQPVMLYTAFKAMSVAAASFGLLVCLVLMGMDGFKAGAGFLWRYLLIALAAILLLLAITYLILILLYRGKYSMLFEMDEAGVLHAEDSRQYQKTRKLSALTTLAGAVAGNAGIFTAGLVCANRLYYARFAQVKAVRAVRNQNLIQVNGAFMRNRIYAAPEQFDFVWQYIVSRCPKGKIYE